MQKMHWLDESHLESLEKGLELAGKLWWNISIQKTGDYWFVKDGEKPIFAAESRDAVDAFIYGLGLAYAGIPDDLLNDLANKLRERGFAE
jgi:hypothetical protein